MGLLLLGFIDDVAGCRSAAATYDVTLKRHRRLRPDVDQIKHSLIKYCAGKNQDLLASWPKGDYHFNVHTDFKYRNNQKGFVQTYWWR